jgi:bifunctional DNA-binding transcriptional regulator/antitoxin component of YhaV-PrlF toxin-antitoxin module
MLAKLTSKNQITIPKRALQQAGAVAETHFMVDVLDGKIILTPARLGAADAVRQKLEALGITDADVADAVRWARAQKAAS